MNQQNPYAPPQVTPPAPQIPSGGELFAPCYKCRSPYANRINWTLWGGVIGPWLLTHVRCATCGTVYNGKSGQSNTTNIVLYFVITFGVAIMIGLAVAIVPIFMS